MLWDASKDDKGIVLNNSQTLAVASIGTVLASIDGWF